MSWPGRNRTVAMLRDLLQREGPDLVIAGPIPEATFLFGLAKARPLVAMSWGSDLLRPVNVWERGRLRKALKHSRILLADCHAVQAAATRLGFDARRTIVFPWGIDLGTFHPDERPSPLRSSLGWLDKTVVVHNRAWEPDYDVHVALQAFARLANERPDARLLLVGDGSLRAEIHAFLRQSGLAEKVHLTGRVPNEDMADVLRCADIYLSATPMDGSSISLLEAMACGLATLAVDNPSNREWVVPGQTGELFPAGDVQALQMRLATMVADPERRRLQGLAGVRVVRERADWSKNAALLNDACRRATEATA